MELHFTVGSCHQDMCQYDLAIQSFEEYLKQSGMHPAAAMNNIGHCHESLGDNTKALEWWGKALEMEEGEGAPPEDISDTMGVIANGLAHQRRFEEALGMYARGKYFAMDPRIFPRCILSRQGNSCLPLDSTLETALNKHLLCHF